MSARRAATLPAGIRIAVGSSRTRQVIMAGESSVSIEEFSTPLMRQYSAIKQRHPNALLFFRLGDFYEMFFEDAVVAAKELQITLTSRNKEKGTAIPMCGIPYHAAEG